MEQIIKSYGTFLLEALVLISLTLLLFAGVTDKEGNRGIFHIAGAYLETGETVEERKDFSGFRSEAGKEPPIIAYRDTDMLYTGDYAKDTLLEARDADGTVLAVEIQSISGPYGMEWSGEELGSAETIRFPVSGIYRITASAVDVGNRRSVCTISIPINRREVSV